MATGYHYSPSEFNAFYKGRNRSQTTVCIPAPSPPKKRASSYYPAQRPEIVDEANPDPFYLEHSLSSDSSWGSLRRGIRNVPFSGETNQYFMLSTVNPGPDLPIPTNNRGETARSHTNINRSTLSVVELEHQLGLQETAGQFRAPESCHVSQSSLCSVQTDATPDLTPSSSFSSNYSGPLHPDTIVRGGTEPQVQDAREQKANIDNKVHLSSTPLNGSRTALLPSQLSTPSRDPHPRVVASNNSTDTLIMPRGNSLDSPSYRGKPLPSLPNASRNNSTRSSKKATSPSNRPPIEASMISPPCRINPVTLEPHTSHFDQALFIPANDCPSPVPSPGPASPSFERPEAGASTTARDRPSTSASEMHCEQSVWESDSDNEDTDSKSLSKNPIDTLKKVRSRVHLRVAKSAPKLQNTSGQTHSHALEKFPSMPEHPPGDLSHSSMRSIVQACSARDVFHPAAQHTLRLVAPSTTSLVRPRTPRSRSNSNPPRNYDIDRSTAAAIQAKSRRRQRSESPEPSLSTEREKVCTFCRDERSDKAIQHSLTLARPPLYKRVWESLRVLGCHGEIAPPRPGKSL
ncbi:hypothetical protein EYZ11_012773 [Aspergillus tanneri]|uniref:Uncharacterized protein n=1 Tax=Aspergillus tanneri TaxID=1220188 RepID=A0A4S3J4R8_9EURO|nr:uncharacterized protein ATNIH1004_007237 [Aspergillus tanneri]KAA8645816.1 hypothetical protein ATNIH1004_007237 [Aspergillus tanneri]THC87781.1 hypothetical protein EYZ11_012773 [Aspergillus tanneri]